MAPKETSWPELKYPSKRDDNITVDKWIDDKIMDDGAEGLWRIHDRLYDLSKYIKNHPGGATWLEITKGTDITEAFETHHLTTKAEKMLPKFYVRPAKTRRNSPFTFHPNGFYKTLKSRVNEYFKNKSPDPSLMSVVTLDMIVVSALLAVISASVYDNYYLATLAGVLLNLIVNCGHNFVHMKDNWRMYYYYLTTFSVREWRISHCLSHHLHTNTIQDLEVSLFEPLIQFLPRSNKNYVLKYMPWLPFLLALPIITTVQLCKRIYTKVFTGYDCIMFVIPLLMIIFGNQSIFSTLLMWMWMIVVNGICFGLIGFTAAHHHPNIFHEGDLPRKDADWGLHQVDAVQDRVEIQGNAFVSLLIYGEHTLHHMFPCLDHVLLPQLYPIFQKTLNEFGIDSNMNTVWDLFIGSFKQLSRVEKNQTVRK